MYPACRIVPVIRFPTGTFAKATYSCDTPGAANRLDYHKSIATIVFMRRGVWNYETIRCRNGRRRKKYELGEPWNAVGYIRCGAQDGWSEGVLRKRQSGASPSRVWKNEEYRAQHARLKRYAAENSLALWRVFFDPMIDQFGRPVALPLSECEELAQLAVTVRECPSLRTVVIDNRSRWSENPSVLALLCDYFRQRDVIVIETGTRTILTADDSLSSLLQRAGATELQEARSLVKQWEKLVDGLTEMGSTRRKGRKPFGFDPTDQTAVNRIRELGRVLPPSKWVRRKSGVKKRLSDREIAHRLEAEGYRQRNGKPISTRMIGNVLRRRRERYERQQTAAKGHFDVSRIACAFGIDCSVFMTRNAWKVMQSHCWPPKAQKAMQAGVREIMMQLESVMGEIDEIGLEVAIDTVPGETGAWIATRIAHRDKEAIIVKCPHEKTPPPCEFEKTRCVI